MKEWLNQFPEGIRYILVIALVFVILYLCLAITRAIGKKYGKKEVTYDDPVKYEEELPNLFAGTWQNKKKQIDENNKNSETNNQSGGDTQ